MKLPAVPPILVPRHSQLEHVMVQTPMRRIPLPTVKAGMIAHITTLGSIAGEKTLEGKI